MELFLSLLLLLLVVTVGSRVLAVDDVIGPFPGHITAASSAL